MRKVININIPKPCHEDWNTMTPKDKGRHCAVCSKTVIDFTKATDEDIVTSLESHGNLCGRFKSSQLNRAIVLSRKDKNNYLSWVASSLFAMLTVGTHTAKAQDTPLIVQTDTTQLNAIKGKVATSILNEKVIRGTVTSVEDGLPLPGVNVIIKGTTKGVQTDFDGNFTIKTNIDDILMLSYVGMKSKEVKISSLNTYNISLTLDEDVSGEVIVVGGAIGYAEPQFVCSAEALKQKRQRQERRQNQLAFYKAKLQQEKKEQKLRRKAIRNGDIERTKTGKLLYKLSNIFRKKE
ncbi:MAG: carboxypeptidase-like regulatory domain-containing protein [Gelidibacter sp.]